MALRCVENSKIKHAWFALNEGDAYDLDDVVVHVTDPEGRRVAYLVQLKHQEHPKNIPNKDFLYDAQAKKKSNMTEDFSVYKYARTYSKIWNNLFRDEIEEGSFNASLRESDEIFYVLYTNRDLGVVHDFLKIDGEENFLDTSSERSVYNFDENKLNFDKDFLRHLKLFVGQSHINRVDEFLKKELRRVTVAIKIDGVDLNALLEKYLDFIEVGTKGVKDEKFDALTKTDVMTHLGRFMLDEYRVRFSLKYENRLGFSTWCEFTYDKPLVLVEADEFTIDFLKSYVSAKIREHYALDNWNEELSKNAVYKKAPGLKAILVKTVADEGLTPIKMYNAFWLLKKVPLLLEAQSVKNCKSIEAALRLTRDRPVFVLTTFETGACFSNINHLSEAHRNLVLNYPITVQKRPGARLSDIVNKSMFKLIKCKEIIDVISQRFNVGDPQGAILDFYEPRSLSKVIFSALELKSIDANFLVRGIDRHRFEDISKEYIEGARSKSKIIYEKTRTKNYHELNFVDEEFFELRNSHESTRKLREHQAVHPQALNEYLFKWSRPHELDFLWTPAEDLYHLSSCVINANPGMGKSELLNHVAANAPASVWILKVNLTDHHDYYKTLSNKTTTPTDHLKEFQDFPNELTEKIFFKYANQKKVMVLFDSFDEFSISYMKEVILIITSLHAAGFKVWVSTRPVTKAVVEEALDTISRTLKPLAIDRQKSFLIRHFGSLTEQTRIVTEFVDELLRAAEINLKDRNNHFTGIPLQTKLLADVFEDDFKKAVETNEVVFNKTFDLEYLYEHFLEDKRKIFCKKFGEIYRDMSKFLEKLQQLFALRSVFPTYVLEDLCVDEKLEEYYEDDDRMIHFLQREGVVEIRRGVATNSKNKFNANFVHRTFAEFLCAKWLYRNYKKEEARDLLTYRFYGLDDFLFGVFDRYLAKGCPLHLSVISRNKNDALKLMSTDLECVKLLDGGRRSFLHLIGCYGTKHPLDHQSEKEFRDEMSDVIDAAPEDFVIDVKDDVLGYNPLEYAIYSESLAVADKLLQRSKELSFSLDLAEKDAFFFYCNRLHYKDLFIFLLKYFVKKDLLHKEIESDVTLEEYCSPYQEITRYALELGLETVLELARTDCDLGFVAAYESESDLRRLLDEGANINRVDRDYNTALHYACAHNRFENAMLLLSRHAHINVEGFRGNNALHLAVENKCEDIVELLISSKINLNCQNNEGDTPLHTAISVEAYNIAHILVDQGADVNLKDDLGMTALHHACEHSSIDLIVKMLPKVTDINVRDVHERSALFGLMSTNEDNLEIIRLLIDNGIDINLQDEYGNTVLHDICSRHCKDLQNLKENFPEEGVTDEDIEKRQAFNKSAAMLLLRDERVRVDVKNKNDYTPLDVALANDHIDWEVLDTLKRL